MPPTQTNEVAKLRFLSDPLPDDLLVAGPSVLNLFASIDQDDTNWIIVLKDVGPDVSVHTAPRSAGARTDARLVEGIPPCPRPCALHRMEAVAPDDAGSAEEDRAG